MEYSYIDTWDISCTIPKKHIYQFASIENARVITNFTSKKLTKLMWQWHVWYHINKITNECLHVFFFFDDTLICKVYVVIYKIAWLEYEKWQPKSYEINMFSITK